MKKRLLLTTLVATMMVSTLLVGCSSTEEDKDNNSTTPATNVEQSDNNDVENSTKEEPTSKEEVSYKETFKKEPDWEELYEETKQGKIDAGWTVEKSESFASGYVEEKKLEYEAMKFVFEDMTQNFKHKKEVSALEPIDVGFSPEPKKNTFICDIKNVMPENAVDANGEPIVFEREKYTEFAGFDVYETNATSWIDNPDIKVSVCAFSVDGQSPLYVNVVLNRNEDGTFVYKSISVHSNLYK